MRALPAVQQPDAEATPPPPTLADVAQLTRASDYSRFVTHNVPTEIKNAALKKLFTDPHFNVMDGLDTYIGDYNTPDPLPQGMLRQMVQSQLLGLFDDEEAPATALAPPPATTPATTAAAVLPDSTLTPLTSPVALAPPDPAAHEDLDLQLQPDAAVGRPGAEPGTGADAGRQH